MCLESEEDLLDDVSCQDCGPWGCGGGGGPGGEAGDGIVWYCTILYYTLLYCTILFYTVLYCTILYYTVLYCTIPYYTVLYRWWSSKVEQVVVPGGARSKVELRPSPGSSGIWKQLQMGVTKLQCNLCPYQSGDRYNMKRHTNFISELVVPCPWSVLWWGRREIVTNILVMDLSVGVRMTMNGFVNNV